MKKLSKLQINSEKLMKNEELITLRGGTNCWCWRDSEYLQRCGITGTAGSYEDCHAMCNAQGCNYASWTGY